MLNDFLASAAKAQIRKVVKAIKTYFLRRYKGQKTLFV